MTPRIPSFGRLALLVVVSTFLVQLGAVRAQTLNEGWNKLEDKYKTVRGRTQLFLKGSETVDPKDNSHVEAIDVLAKYHTYGVYLRKLDTQPSGIKRDYEEFEKSVNDILKAKNAQAIQPLADVFSSRIGTHALEVLQFSNALPIHKVHNARILAKTAELGQAPLAETLINALKDNKQNDGVRYYMLKGLAALLPQIQPPQQAKCAEALVEFLQQKKTISKNADIQEIDGFRFLRREAIRALAKYHTPAINDKVRPALVLARFAGNDVSIQPPPRIDERLEASIGLARMQAPQKDKLYQADYAAGQIAKALGAMAQLADYERANNVPRTYPWIILGAQLKDAMQTLKKNNAQNKYIVSMVDRGGKLLDQVMNKAQINPNEQTWWTSNQSDPPSKELFQGAADSSITPAPAIEPEGK